MTRAREHAPNGSSEGVTLDARDEHVLEELARAAARAPVHVPAEALVEPQAGALEDLRVEVAPVVDDDQRPARPGAAAPRTFASTSTIPSEYAASAALLVPAAAAPTSSSRRSSRPSSS